MIILRKSGERGHANHGWLDSYFSFSFAEYHDPRHMGFAALRVINEDRVQPGKGFGTHKDSMGNGSVIRVGDVQRMSAGRGVQHSEFNPSPGELVHLLQIWIEPNITGIEPGYEEKHFDAASKRGKLRLIASSDGRDSSVTIHQDAAVYAALIDGAERVTHPLAPQRKAYVHVARGTVSVNGNELSAGDALKASGESGVVIERGSDAEVLLFDLA
jgi:hypothetical protein